MRGQLWVEKGNGWGKVDKSSWRKGARSFAEAVGLGGKCRRL